jgi:cysteine synthase A
MFRTAARQFAASARRSAEAVSFEANHQTAIGISKAQGISQRGLLDGMSMSIPKLE